MGHLQAGRDQATSTNLFVRWWKYWVGLLSHTFSWSRNRRRVPVLTQMEETECGAVCLAMILHYYGHQAPLVEVRERCGVGRDGASAKGIVTAARSYGLRDRSISVQQSDLRFAKLPAIVFWQFTHFLVVERWTPKIVEVVDPNGGRRRLTAEEFDEGFTGIVIMLEPGEQFQPGAYRPTLSLPGYIRDLCTYAPHILGQVLLVSLLLQALGLITPLLTKVVVDHIIPLQLNHIMLLVAGGLLVIVATQTVTTLLRSLLLVYLQARLDIRMTVAFFDHLLRLPYTFFQRRLSGDLLARLGSLTTIRETVSSQLISALLDGGMLLTYFAILLWQSPLFSGFVLVLAGLRTLLLLTTNRPIRELMARELAAVGKTQGYVAEVLTGMATLKASGAEQRAMGHWSNLFFDQMNVSVRRDYVFAWIAGGFVLLDTLAPLALLWLGAMQVLNGVMTIGTMLALIALATAFFNPLSSFVNSLQQLQLVRAEFERVADVLAAETEQELAHAHPAPPLQGQITLQNVTLRYAPEAPVAVQAINLSIAPGQKVAIVGATGSGKSTLGKLLLGLMMPTEGDVSYDGQLLTTMQYQTVREQFGVVLQEASIFSGSIRDNIAFNDPEMDLEQIMMASQLAAIDEEIMQMPMGYDTRVSEGGSALSGGQRQRLALARAIAHQPAILLLDEATSHLDVLTEQQVEANLAQLNCTRVVIAHRLSTVWDADLILVLEQGRLLEQGTHSELVANQGYYARLIESQTTTYDSA